MSDAAAPLAGWDCSPFEAAGIRHDVYRKGSGPGVVVIHEIPGITPAVAAFADEVVGRGCTVMMPSLTGEPGRPPTSGYMAAQSARLCVAREFGTWAVGKTSPVVAWLRALARSLHLEVGGPGVGAVGMCFSGGFALGMMIDDVTIAPVLSQPALPLPIGERRAAELGLSDDDLATVVARVHEGCRVLGLRYTDDWLVGDRFTTLKGLLGDGFIAVELPSSHRRDHSVLTEHRDDAAVERVLDFLTERLLPSA